jgi:hypothetical protein
MQNDEKPAPLRLDESVGSGQAREPSWEQLVLEQHRFKCENCGNKDRLRVKMIVPEEAGGKKAFVDDPATNRKTAANGTVLCRVCDMATDIVSRQSDEPARHRTPDDQHRPVNFWVSRPLFDKVKAFNGFTSTSSLVRYLIGKYVSDEKRFDDLEMYQDDGTDVKINVWVDPASYEQFKGMVNARGLTVTDALKSLLRMYGAEAEPLMKTTRS